MDNPPLNIKKTTSKLPKSHFRRLQRMNHTQLDDIANMSRTVFYHGDKRSDKAWRLWTDPKYQVLARHAEDSSHSDPDARSTTKREKSPLRPPNLAHATSKLPKSDRQKLRKMTHQQLDQTVKLTGTKFQKNDRRSDKAWRLWTNPTYQKLAAGLATGVGVSALASGAAYLLTRKCKNFQNAASAKLKTLSINSTHQENVITNITKFLKKPSNELFVLISINIGPYPDLIKIWKKILKCSHREGDFEKSFALSRRDQLSPNSTYENNTDDSISTSASLSSWVRRDSFDPWENNQL